VAHETKARPMTYRVVEWSTGNVGRHAIAGIDARPDLELVGVFVSDPAKVGRDAGELAGLGRHLGVEATNDVDALLALEPDCIVHTAMADHRLFEALEDLASFLAAGINVVSSGPVFLQYPYGIADELAEPVIAAAHKGGVSLFVNGIDPVSATTSSPRADRDLRADRRGALLRDPQLLDLQPGHGPLRHHGFGKPMDEVPFCSSRACPPWPGAALCASWPPGSTSSSTRSSSGTSGSRPPMTSRSTPAR